MSLTNFFDPTMLKRMLGDFPTDLPADPNGMTYGEAKLNFDTPDPVSFDPVGELENRGVSVAAAATGGLQGGAPGEISADEKEARLLDPMRQFKQEHPFWAGFYKGLRGDQKLMQKQSQAAANYLKGQEKERNDLDLANRQLQIQQANFNRLEENAKEENKLRKARIDLTNAQIADLEKAEKEFTGRQGLFMKAYQMKMGGDPSLWNAIIEEKEAGRPMGFDAMVAQAAGGGGGGGQALEGSTSAESGETMSQIPEGMDLAVGEKLRLQDGTMVEVVGIQNGQAKLKRLEGMTGSSQQSNLNAYGYGE